MTGGYRDPDGYSELNERVKKLEELAECVKKARTDRWGERWDTVGRWLRGLFIAALIIACLAGLIMWGKGCETQARHERQQEAREDLRICRRICDVYSQRYEWKDAWSCTCSGEGHLHRYDQLGAPADVARPERSRGQR